ncbi:MAG: DUF1189 family protein [Lachnospiraceae bacterium]|nr:DUF1189 family protein [Lachnospiraceae bacterium]
MQQTDKIGFLQMFQIAVAKPKEYKKALNVKKRTIIGFVILVALLAVLLGTIVPIVSFSFSIGGPKHFITETLPAFEYKDGIFHIDERVEIVDNGIRIIADSDVEEFKEDDVEDDTIVEILISKNNMRMKNSIASQQNMNFDFKDVGKGTFTNKDLLEYIPLLFLGLVLGAVVVFLATIYRYLISALIFAVCGRSVARAMRKDLSFGKCYVLSLMAKTSIEIVNCMGMAADITFMNSMVWAFISFGIIMAYLYFGIKEIGLNKASPEF